jgi:hypothetical protein
MNQEGLETVDLNKKKFKPIKRNQESLETVDLNENNRDF